MGASERPKLMLMPMLDLSVIPTALSSPTTPTCMVMLATMVTIWASVTLRLMLDLSVIPMALSSPTTPTCMVMQATMVTTLASVTLRLMLVLLVIPMPLSFPTMPTNPSLLIPMELLSLWSLLQLLPLEPTTSRPSTENERRLIEYYISGDGHLFFLKTIM